MTHTEKQQQLDYIATLTDDEVRIQFNVDYRHEIIEAIQAEYPDDDEEPDFDEEAYWRDYEEDMLIERRKEYSLTH